MAQIHIQLLRGSNAGRTATFVQERITFGRSADTTLMVDVPYASREHGEIVFMDGQWMLINHSPNGTSVSGKIYKDNEPHPLKSGDTIGVGKKNVMFSVAFETPETEVAPDFGEPGDEQEIDPDAARRRNTMRVWGGVAIFWLIVIVAGVVISQASSSGDDEKKVPVNMMTRDQIAAEIRRPITDVTFDARKAKEALEAAENFYTQRKTDTAALYKAHQQYQLALALADKSGFDENPEAQLNFKTAQDELIDVVFRKYRDAWYEFSRRSYENAAERFKELAQIYQDHKSPFYQHLQLMWRRSHDEYERRRKG